MDGLGDNGEWVRRGWTSRRSLHSHNAASGAVSSRGGERRGRAGETGQLEDGLRKVAMSTSVAGQKALRTRAMVRSKR